MGAPKLRVAVLGCSGSIGRQTLDVCRQHADKIDVVALSVNSSVSELVRDAVEFHASYVSVADESYKDAPELSDLPFGCHLSFGSDAVSDLARLDVVDCVCVSIVGAAGLSASHAALEAGKRLALSNKESLVVAGDLLIPLARKMSEKAGEQLLLPVDSEHSAIFQCYQGEDPKQAHCIWLTCSGGPFFGMTREQLKSVKPSDALAHPTWSMGAKITVDSATLMNKGLERIEAMHLFDCDLDDIRVLIQRQSKIHSMVEYDDGSVIAHLGASDMRIPIQYAFSYPDRWVTPAPRIDFTQLGSLEFSAPDPDAFRCLALAEEAGRRGGSLPCVLNAANEVAVDAFLHNRCLFTDIDRVVETCMDKHDVQRVESYEQLSLIDSHTRSFAAELIESIDFR